MLFAQITAIAPDVVANGLATQPLAWICLLSLAANWYQYRDRAAYVVATDLRIQAMHDAQLAASRDSAKGQVDLLLQVVPLSAKLAEGVEVLERLSHRTGG